MSFTAVFLALLAVWIIGAVLVARGIRRANPSLGRSAGILVGMAWPTMISRPLNLIDVVAGRFDVQARQQALRA